MRTSETITKLLEDFIKVQQQLKNAVKSADNPHFKSKYADLAAIRDCTATTLSQRNLAIIQTTDFDDAGRFYLLTRLVHVSGEWIEATFPLPYIPDKPQIMGSAITYARRYSWSAICSIAAGLDDDGEATRAFDGNGHSTTPGPNHAISKAFSKKNISPLSEPGGPSAYVSKPRYEALYNELGRQTTLRALDAWYDATKGDREKMAKDFQRQMILEFFAQGFRVAKSADNLMTFWANYEKDIEDIKRASQEHYQILYEDYGLALDGFTNNVNAG